MRPKAVLPSVLDNAARIIAAPIPRSSRVRVHHQLRHRGPILRLGGQIQIAEDLLAACVGGQQMLGAVMRQLAQNLLTDGCHPIEFALLQ